MTWTVVFDNKNGYSRQHVEAKTFAEAKRKGVAAEKAATGKRKVKAVQVYNSGKSNPKTDTKVPVGKWLKAKVNRNGTITLKVPGKRK